MQHHTPSPSTAPGSGPGIKALDHVAIAVYDADPAVEWFRDRLGLTVVNDEIVRGNVNVRLVFLATPAGAGSTTMQVVAPVGPGAVADHLRRHGEGLHHICFKVDDVRSTLDALDEPTTPTFVGGYALTCAFLAQGTPSDINVELVGEA